MANRDGGEREDFGQSETAARKARAPRRGPSASPRAWRDAAVAGTAATIAGGAGGYERARMLPRLIALDPRELDAAGPSLDKAILTRLRRALRAERLRGRAGHWTYDLNRHVALLQALAVEQGRRRRSGANRTCRSTASETKSAARVTGRR